MPTKKEPADPLWVSVPKAARALDLDPRTVRKLVRDGKLHGRVDLGAMRVYWPDVVGKVSHGSWCLPEPADEVAA